MARFALAQVAEALEREGEIWYELVRVRRQVSRAAYHELAGRLLPLRPRPGRYRFKVGETPVLLGAEERGRNGRPPLRKSRRPPNALNSAG